MQRDGEFVFYRIEYRLVGQGKRGERDSKIYPVLDDQWHRCEGDYWRHWIARVNWTDTHEIRPVNRPARAEMLSVNHHTGVDGWWSRKHAQSRLDILRAASHRGELDHFDTQHSTKGVWSQACRYEFRLVRMHVKQSTTVIEGDSLCRVVRRSEKSSRKSSTNSVKKKGLCRPTPTKRSRLWKLEYLN